MATLSSPIHLTATADVQPGSEVGANAAALVNPYGLPMEIHEIRFGIEPAAWETLKEITFANIAVRLTLGNINLTGGFVPIALLGPQINADAEIGVFRWRLPHPLFVPAGAVLVPSFKHLSISAVGDSVRISYSGQLRDKNYRPKRLIVPYAAAWVAKGMEEEEADTDESIETDLTNPFDQPLHLQRLCARVFYFTRSSGQISDARSVYYDTVSVRMDHSDGFQIIRDFTPIGSIFHPGRRAWDTNGAVLPPQTYIKAFLSKAAGSESTIIAYPMLSIVGWREGA